MLITRPFPLRSPDPPAASGDPPPPAFTEAQTTALAELIGKTVNAAVTSHLKRQPSAADEVKKLLTKDTLAPILAELAPPKEPEAPKVDPSKPDPKVTALEAQLQELKAQRQADIDALKKAQEASRDKDAMAALRSTLAPHVRPEALEIAARDLFLAQKRVTFDDQGNPLFTVRRPEYSGGPEVDAAMPLTDGVQHWLKSDEGKFFAPPPGGGNDPRRGPPAPRGTGRSADGMPTYDKPATTDAEKIRRAAESAEALRLKYPHLA